MLQEIRVRFSPSDDNRFRVQFTDAAGIAQGVEADLKPFLTEDDYQNLRWYLEDYMDLPDGGAVTRAEGIEKQLHQCNQIGTFIPKLLYLICFVC